MAQKCGPSSEEAGAAVIMSAPLAFLATGLLLSIVTVAWRAVGPPVAAEWRGWWRVLAVAVGVAVVMAIAGPSGAYEWVGFAFLVYGSFVCAYSLIGWRVMKADPASVWKATGVVLLLSTAPAVPMLLGGNYDIVALWFYGSGVLWGGPAVFALLLLEVVVRVLARRDG